MGLKKLTLATLSGAQLMAFSINADSEFASFNQSEENFRSAWDENNDPQNLDPTYEKRFFLLPLKGRPKHFPYTSTYSPNFLGGIALRVKNNEVPFKYRSPSREEVMKMTLEEIDALSPAEKYDIFKGDFKYPTVYRELGRTNPKSPKWAGLCHGWAPSAINFFETKGTVMTSVDGVQVPFSTHDIKSLLAYYQGEIDETPAEFLGVRCEGGPLGLLKISADCRGVNPGAFHVVLANEVGIKGKSFVFDRDPGAQVWNQPVVGYSSTIYKQKSGSGLFALNVAHGTKRRVYIETRLTYTDEVSDLTVEELNKVKNRLVSEVVYKYRLELDANDRIIGGSWISIMRPDFLWRHERPVFAGYYGDIETIYNQAEKVID